MKTITFALQKGGTGKTSVSVSVAYELAKKHKVIFIDADPQGNASSWCLTELENEFADALLNSEKEIKNFITHTENENLDFLATAGIGGELRKYAQSDKPKDYHWDITDLCEKLSMIYEYCVIDTSPSFSPLERNCFLSSDLIIPVLQLNQFSVDGLTIFTNNLNDVKSKERGLKDKANMKAIVLNAKDSRIASQNQNLELMKSLENNGIKTFVIPTDQAFNKAQKLNMETQAISGIKKETTQALSEIAEFIEKA